MTNEPILLVGGSGTVGRSVARILRETHPSQPLLIAGRELAKAEEAASAVGKAEAVTLDLESDDLGLEGRSVSAVVVLFTEERLATLRFAQDRVVPHISISRGIFEMGPEVAAFTHRPMASAVVLGTEWLVGATTIPTLALTKAFGRVERIKIGALLDEQDTTGPAGNVDFDRQTAVLPAALTRRNGVLTWVTGDDLTSRFRAADGTETEATPFSVNDVLALAAATRAPDIEFHLAMGTSSSRRRGEPFSTEIIIELEGEDETGRPLRTRHAVFHPQGQMPPTGLGIALLLERLLGLDGMPPVQPGLYFPYQLLEQATYLARFQQIGGQILDLEGSLP